MTVNASTTSASGMTGAGYDHFSDEQARDPHRLYKQMREECPVAHAESNGGFWVLTRYEDVVAAAREPQTFSSRQPLIPAMPIFDVTVPPINIDPPDHTRARRILAPLFSGKAVTLWQDAVTEICRSLIEDIGAAERCDAVLSYAQAVPIRVFSRLLGIPVEDESTFSEQMRFFAEMRPDDTDVFTVWAELAAYFHTHIEARRASGPLGAEGDLLDHLLASEALEDGGIDPLMTVMVILFGGVDTTANALGSALYHFARNDDDRAALIADGQRIPAAVEEVLRYYAPVSIGRLVCQETSIGGETLRPGEQVMLVFPSANRDESVFEDAETFVLDREVNPHLAFGSGVHRCLGAQLARLEMRIAVAEWLRAFPAYRLTGEDDIAWATGHDWGPRVLPVVLGARD
jgi:cytochrome P450